MEGASIPGNHPLCFCILHSALEIAILKFEVRTVDLELKVMSAEAELVSPSKEWRISIPGNHPLCFCILHSALEIAILKFEVRTVDLELRVMS